METFIIAIISFILGAGIGFFLIACLKIEKESEKK